MFLMRAEFTFRLPGVDANQIHLGVENANQPRVPANPQRPTEKFRRHTIVRLVDREVAIATDFALSFFEVGKPVAWKSAEFWLFVFQEQLLNLLPSRAMNSRVGNSGFPTQQVFVLFRQTGKRATLKGIVLNVVHTPFDFAFVTRGARFGRKEHGTVMFTEAHQFGIEIGVVPIRGEHSCFQVVGDKCCGDASKVLKGIFQDGDQVVGRLSKDGFTVAFREWLRTIRKTWVRRRRPSASMIGAPVPKSI